MLDTSIGTVSILNVGEGDTKLSFNPKNPAECIRAARIIQDMIKRGYALLVDTGNHHEDGTIIYSRALGFDETKYEYIIADLDPVVAQQVDRTSDTEHHISLSVGSDEEILKDSTGSPTAEGPEAPPAPFKAPKGNGRRTKRLSATRTGAVAVGRSAGG